MVFSLILNLVFCVFKRVDLSRLGSHGIQSVDPNSGPSVWVLSSGGR